MNKTRILGGIGAALVVMSATGAVAYASTTSNSGRSSYASEIKTETQQIKSLQTARKNLNEQLKSAFQSLKGQHFKKTNPSAYEGIRATHEQILADRAKLPNDNSAIQSDRASKNWAQLVTALQTKATDLQALVGDKEQQLKNVQALGGSTQP